MGVRFPAGVGLFQKKAFCGERGLGEKEPGKNPGVWEEFWGESSGLGGRGWGQGEQPPKKTPEKPPKNFSMVFVPPPPTFQMPFFCILCHLPAILSDEPGIDSKIFRKWFFGAFLCYFKFC